MMVHEIFSLPDPILVHILSYLLHKEIQSVSHVNKQLKTLRREQITSVKPKTRFLVNKMKMVDKKYFDLLHDTGEPLYPNTAFASSGCEIISISRDPSAIVQEKNYMYSDRYTRSEPGGFSLLLKTKPDNQRIRNREGRKLKILIEGRFAFLKDINALFCLPEIAATTIFTQLQLTNEFSDDRDCQLLRGQPQLIEPLFMYEIITNVLDRIISLALDNYHRKQMSVARIEKIISQLTSPEFRRELKKCEKEFQINVQDCRFNVEYVQSLMQNRYTFSFEENVAKFLTGFLSSLMVKIWRDADSYREENDDTGIDRMSIAVIHDKNLSALINLDEIEYEKFNSEWIYHKDWIKALDGEIMDEKDGYLTIKTANFNINLEAFLFFQFQPWWDTMAHGMNEDVEGVVFVDNIVPEKLNQSILELLKKNKTIDRSPFEDLVHNRLLNPRLYSYDEELSEFIPSKDLSDPHFIWEEDNQPWLATYVDYKEDGLWRFRNEINNLPRSENESLYTLLEELFTITVPYFEHVVGYSKITAKLNSQKKIDDEDDSNGKTYIRPYKLTGKSLQIVCKIGDSSYEPGNHLETPLLYDSFSHEHIIAKAIYTVEKDKDLKEEIIYTRKLDPDEFTTYESERLNSHSRIFHFFDSSGCPLGKVPTKPGRLIVVPESHFYKRGCVFNPREDDNISSSTIMFFLVDPDIRVVSTQEVTPKSQQKNISALAAASQILRIENNIQDLILG